MGIWIASLFASWNLGLFGRTEETMEAATPAEHGSTLEPGNRGGKYEVFDPRRRPDFAFSGRLDAGRRSVIEAGVAQSGFVAVDGYARLGFSGLDSESRMEALRYLGTMRQCEMQSAAIRVVFEEWSLVDPEAAFVASKSLNYTLRQVAQNYALAAWLLSDPEAALVAIAEHSLPDDIVKLYSQLIDTTRNLDWVAEISLAIGSQVSVSEDEAIELLGLFRGDQISDLELALEFWETVAFGGRDAIWTEFDDWIGGRVFDPDEWPVIRAWVLQQPDSRMRAGLVESIAEAWIEIDAADALKSSGALMPGLREETHAAVFLSLLRKYPETALAYFDSMPVGGLRDHLLARSAEDWFMTFGFESIFSRIPSVESATARAEIVRSLLGPSVQNMHGSHLELEMDPPRLLEALSYLSDPSDRRANAVMVYQAWASRGGFWGDASLATIEASMAASPFLDPNLWERNVERIRATYRRGVAMRKEPEAGD